MKAKRLSEMKPREKGVIGHIEYVSTHNRLGSPAVEAVDFGGFLPPKPPWRWWRWAAAPVRK